MESFKRYEQTGIPVVTKNIMIVNTLVLVATELLGYKTLLFERFALYYPFSPEFNPVQLLTHIFLHGGFFHFFFNMFTLFNFGILLERIWGAKRFFTFYILTGIGAAVFYSITKILIVYYYTGGVDLYINMPIEVSDPIVLGKLGQQLAPCVGASGAICGVLAAFAVLFPNTMIMSMIPPIPMKAKYFIPLFMLLSLTMGVANFSWDNIAHFAHLGGAVIGYILVKYWNMHNKTEFY